jgi:hypothetical protein
VSFRSRWLLNAALCWKTSPREPLRKYNFGDMERIAARKGGKCLSKAYRGVEKKLRWQRTKGVIPLHQPDARRWFHCTATTAGAGGLSRHVRVEKHRRIAGVRAPLRGRSCRALLTSHSRLHNHQIARMVNDGARPPLCSSSLVYSWSLRSTAAQARLIKPSNYSTGGPGRSRPPRRCTLIAAPAPTPQPGTG